MANRDGRRQRADRKTARTLTELGTDLRDARVGSGLSLESIAASVGISRWQAARIERGDVAELSILALNRMAAANGHTLSVKLFPTSDPIRDAAHVRLLERLRSRLHPAFRWQPEVAIPSGSRLRAWDAIAEADQDRTAIEAETRIYDGQALERKLMTKLADDPRIDRLILLVADTRANRAALGWLREGLRASFPLDTREVLAAFGSGRHPASNGIVIL